MGPRQAGQQFPRIVSLRRGDRTCLKGHQAAIGAGAGGRGAVRAQAGWAEGRCLFCPPSQASAGPTVCARAGTEQTPPPPSLSFQCSREDPDRQRSGSGSPEEGRGAHSSDGGLPPVELPAAPAGWTCPCMDGGGGRLGGPGLWTEHPQGCPRGPCARKGQALTLLPVRLPPVPSPPFWAPSWTILGGLLSAPRLSLPQAAGGLRTAQHAWFRPGAPCPPSAGPAGARRAPGG